MSLLPAWEKLPPLCRCYIRLLDPDGDVFDVWQNDLEATLEGLNDHHRVFRSNKKWQAFLDSQRAIATEWDLRNTLTDADRRFLDSLKISWEPLSGRARRYQLYGQPPLSLTTEQLMEAATQTVKQMSPEEKTKLRQQPDDQLTSLMRARQTLVCGDCGAVIEGEDLPQEEDWICPNCGCPSNLELTWVMSIQGGVA